MNLVRLIVISTACMICMVTGCSKPASIIESDPSVTLQDVPAGFRYVKPRSTDSLIYQAAPTESTYDFRNCDSLIGRNAYKALLKYMSAYDIETVIISEDHSIYILEMPRTADPNDHDSYVYYSGEYAERNFVVESANELLYANMPITQSQDLGNSWFRVTAFDGRGSECMGLFDF